VLALAFTAACGSDRSPTAPLPLPPHLLKDIVIEHLPSPYYHFEYDATGRLTTAAFASGLRVYDVRYAGGQLSELRNDVARNGDRLVYFYDDGGRVREVDYVDATGQVYTHLYFAYVGPELTGLLRERRLGVGFISDKAMSMSYDADGNLVELTHHYLPIPGIQDEATFVDRFEQYDTGTNVDGFGLLHSEFFDHLVLLPGVRLQKGNPRKETRSGDGLNYSVDFVYTYDGENRPLTKTGSLTITNGTDAGRRIQTSAGYSYY
jgi:hypothetical protein